LGEGAENRVTEQAKRFETRGLTVDFVGLRAVDHVDLVLRQGEILGFIGPNGAGKTTLVNAMTGVQSVSDGGVFLDGVEVTKWTPFRLARAGVGRTFQSVKLFNGLTVLENVEVGAVGVGVGRGKARRKAMELLKWAHLADKAEWRADSLPAGEERRLGILRALAMEPRFVLLDEPAAGLNERESDDLVQAIFNIRERFGCGVLVIEHDMRLIMRLCDRIQVIDYGKTICIGTPEQVQLDPAVITAYLGTTKVGAHAKH
jgi:branched-chain amino acid transport system ATP-binding protein